jgi:hypothetical protein
MTFVVYEGSALWVILVRHNGHKARGAFYIWETMEYYVLGAATVLCYPIVCDVGMSITTPST